MDDKPKNDKLKNDVPRIGNIMFLVLWLAGHIGAWLLALGVNQLLTSQQIYIHSDFLLVMLMALGTGIPTAIVQLLLVERGLKRSMRGWLPVSIIGWALSGWAFSWFWTGNIYYMIPNSLSDLLPRIWFVPLFAPVAVLQWLWLRRKAPSASLWVLAAVAGGLLFTMIQSVNFFGIWYYRGWAKYALVAASALLYSGVTGVTMLYLQIQSSQKAKNDVTHAEQADMDDAKSLTRLSDENDEQTGLADLNGSSSVAKAAL